MVNGKLSCWWLTYPSEKYEFVSWDDYSQLIWKNKSHVPNDQPGLLGVFNYAQHPPLDRPHSISTVSKYIEEGY